MISKSEKYQETKQKINSILSYDISILHGNEFNAPVWVVINLVQKDIDKFQRLGYDWHTETLEHHLNLFKRECNGYHKDTPIKTVLTTNSGGATDTHHSQREGGESKEGGCLG